MLRFPCVGCGKTIKADEQHIGRRGMCPACGNAFIVPGPTAPTATQPVRPVAADDSVGQPTPASNVAGRRNVILASGAVAVLLAGGYLVWRSGRANPAASGPAPVARNTTVPRPGVQPPSQPLATVPANALTASPVTSSPAAVKPVPPSREKVIADGQRIMAAGAGTELSHRFADRVRYVNAWYANASDALSSDSIDSAQMRAMPRIDPMLNSTGRAAMTTPSNIPHRVSVRIAVLEGQVRAGDMAAAARSADAVYDLMSTLIDPRNPMAMNAAYPAAVAYALSGRRDELNRLLGQRSEPVQFCMDMAALARSNNHRRNGDLAGAAQAAAEIQGPLIRLMTLRNLAGQSIFGTDRPLASSLCRKTLEAWSKTMTKSVMTEDVALEFVATIAANSDPADEAAGWVASKYPQLAEIAKAVAADPDRLLAPRAGTDAAIHASVRLARAKACLGDLAGAKSSLQARLGNLWIMPDGPEKLDEAVDIVEVLVKMGALKEAAKAAARVREFPNIYDQTPVQRVAATNNVGKIAKNTRYRQRVIRAAMEAGDLDLVLAWAAASEKARQEILGDALDAWFSPFVPEWESVAAHNLEMDFMRSVRTNGPGPFPGSMPPGALPPGAMPPGAMPPGAMPPGMRGGPNGPGNTAGRTPNPNNPPGTRPPGAPQ